jgi:hypothetical protein
MNTSQLSKRLIFLEMLIFASGAAAAVTLIGPDVRNGGFESGAIAPWLGDLQLTQDPVFASHGIWYAGLQGVGPGTVRKIAFQFLPANKSDGLTFTASFDVRSGAIGFDSLGVQLFAVNSNSNIVNTIEAPALFTGFVSSQWSSYQTQFHVPATWDGGGPISLQFLFSQPNAISGTTYTDFLDNIVLQQIPEPADLFPLGTFALLLASKNARRLLRAVRG